jgi:hypothetical protein
MEIPSYELADRFATHFDKRINDISETSINNNVYNGRKNKIYFWMELNN